MTSNTNDMEMKLAHNFINNALKPTEPRAQRRRNMVAFHQQQKFKKEFLKKFEQLQKNSNEESEEKRRKEIEVRLGTTISKEEYENLKKEALRSFGINV